MNSIGCSHQEALKRRWDETRAAAAVSPLYRRLLASSSSPSSSSASAFVHDHHHKKKKMLLGGLMISATNNNDEGEEDLSASVVPPVTVVLEGRSICHRIHLHNHAGYDSLAAALRKMFIDITECNDQDNGTDNITGTDGLDLSNAVPGYLIAYEDMEDDLLLAGDLNWKDFVKVAKRIRIIPAKPSRRRRCRQA